MTLIDPVRGSDSVVLGFQDLNQWEQWKPVTFPGVKKTWYEFDTGTKAVCSRADSSASGFGHPFPGELEDYPVLTWEWKIDHVLPDGDARKKEGDDYPARVYVNFERTSRDWSWWERTKASTFETFYGTEIPGKTLNFIWANKLPVNDIVTSAYTRHARLIALQSGNEKAGTWQTQTVNIRDWYRKAFDDTPPPVQSVAIMTDSDNTNSTARACFRNITLSSGR